MEGRRETKCRKRNYQGMEPGGELRELSGAGTKYPGVKQLETAVILAYKLTRH